MIAFAKANPYFERLNTCLLGLSVDSNPSHLAWIYDIYCRTGIVIPFPIIADRNGEIARKYGISDSGSIRPLSEEDRAEMARDKAEREANKKQRQTRQDTRSYSAKGNSEARIFGLTAEQLANDEPLKINGNGNIKVSMKNVKIGDTYVSSREYERKTSNNSQQQARASEKEDDFEVGPEVYEQIYMQTRNQQKGFFAKLKEAIRTIFKDEKDRDER